MVRILLLGLGASLAMGAVTIAPRRDDRPPREERRESAPAPAPQAAPAPRSYQGPGRVGIAPRESGGGTSWSSPATSGYSRPAGAIGPSDYRAPGAATGIYRHDVVRPARYHHWYGGGSHWYGYYGGSRWFWTRPYGGYWWWYDEPYGRWAWYNGGHWWYTGPAGVAVVYASGAPPAPSGVEAQPAVAPSGDAGPWTSPDGRRLVEVAGPDRQAVLYDKTGPAPSYLRLLGTGASKVRFSAKGAGPSILVEFSDGSFSVFDEDGKPLGAAPAASTTTVKVPVAPPPPPELPKAPVEP